LQKHPNSKYAVLESCKAEIIKLRKQVAGLNKLLDEKESP
jgi:outer membrane protein assembly factor BamD (BamD/ComL family)